MEKGAAIIVKFNWHGTRQSEFWTFDFFRSKYGKRIDSEKKGGGSKDAVRGLKSKEEDVQ